ncbi:MAG: alpha,alpha-trehalose-phosphate synthase [Rhizobiales bacterium]|nr:alpha,alpha-trehalose-phosphate synthase [Hyphomicrobiales bacterium]
MSRLVVVSNRVADLESGAQSGGLAVAVASMLEETGGLWFGWDGNIIEEETERTPNIVRHGRATVATIPLSRSEYETYYLGYSNKVLWPSFHYRLGLLDYESSFNEGYRRVNAMIADHLATMISPTDLVWIHDYHLIPLASELRKRGVKSRIGFFLHIPFPPPDVVVAVPEHAWLIETMFAYDVVGFQTSSDVTNFQRYVLEQADGVLKAGGQMSAFGRTIVVRSFPIGIDVDAVAKMAHTPEADASIRLLATRTLNRAQIIGVDRLDYTKGLPDRVRAFRRLLELYPENIKRVILMQIAPPTREEVAAYVEIREELEGLSGNINGEFGDFDWTPVRYIHRAIPRDILAALFRGSKAGLVTPLRDGMNLVAKEYIAAQDEDDPGVLILSRFAGAAEDLEEALIVNPYDMDDVATAMQRALKMPLQERVERHRALLGRARAHDVTHWREQFLKALANAQHRYAA